jgi:uncharacterized damage-inducible protein DinB
MKTNDLSHYRYRGARALVIIHDQHLREFYETWKQAKAVKVVLPQTEDPDYQSLEHVLHHALRAARGYMTWMCEQLGLPDPQIQPAPPPERAQAEADQYLEYVLEKWREPLAAVPEERFEEAFPSRWKTVYCIDAMLEHAVVHPMRHTFQLRELLEKQKTRN